MNLYTQIERDLTKNKIVCDLRSDTVTRPCEGMRDAMYNAAVGDDVYGEDPSVNMLESELAKALGKEAGLLLSSGTQSNLCAIMAHCGRGEEVIVGSQYHVYIDEAAGASVLAGVALYSVEQETDGSISPATIKSAVKEDDPHCPISKLLSLENTVHGQAIPLQTMRASAAAAKELGLNVHLDGARFFNAVTELECSPEELASVADSVSICLSKGLGAPAGTVLVGSKELIARARRNRKILGGGMRQVGSLAAAGLYGLQHAVPKLKEDHRRAKKLAAALRDLDCGTVSNGTNMVFLTPDIEDHALLHSHLAELGVLIGGQRPTIRMVTHRDINDDNIDAAIEGFRTFFS